MTTPQMDWLDDQRRKRAVSSDDVVLGDYVLAPSGIGPLAHVWANEPFRLIYDLCHEIERLRAEVAVLRDELRLAGEEARRG